MSYRSWIKLLVVLIAINTITLGGLYYGKKKYETAWEEYKEQRVAFMSVCESKGSNWSSCWESFNKDQSRSLKEIALNKAYPFDSKNSNELFIFAIKCYGGLAGAILLSVFSRAAHQFFKA